MKLRNLIILIVIAAAVVFAAIKLREKPEAVSVDAGIYYPELRGRLNDVATISSRQGDLTTTLERKDGKWLLAERGGYPADVNKIREFLGGMADLTRLEKKTDNPELYTKLDLEDPTATDSKAIQFTLKAEDDSTLADLVIGKDRSSTSDLDKRDLYVRAVDDPQSWLVESDIKVFRSQLEWIDPKIVNIHRDRIEQLFVDHPFGDDVFLNRSAPDVDDYTLKDVPEEKQLEYKFQLKDMANVFTSLDFDDVAVNEGVDFAAEGVLKATLDTFDGLRIVMQLGDRDGEKWARFQADQSGRDITVDMELSEHLKPADALAQEIEELNAYWKGWIYKVRDFKLESITRAKDELLSDGNPAAVEGDAGPESSPLIPGDGLSPDAAGGLQLSPQDLQILDQGPKAPDMPVESTESAESTDEADIVVEPANGSDSQDASESAQPEKAADQ